MQVADLMTWRSYFCAETVFREARSPCLMTSEILLQRLTAGANDMIKLMGIGSTGQSD